MATPDAPPYPDDRADTAEARGVTAEQGEPWLTSKDGRAYIARGGGRKGVIYRQGDETPIQARERDASPPRPRKKSPKLKKPDAPRDAELKELERILTEALKQPALIMAGFGDEWPAEHILASAPAVSRNLVVASEHNPWLRRRLEDAASGQDAALAVLTLIPLLGSIGFYIVPLLIYYGLLNAGERTRKMLGDIPHRNGRPPDYAATQSPPFPFPPPGAAPPTEPPPAPPAPEPAA